MEIKHEKKKFFLIFHEITTAKLEKENQTNKQENHNNKERTSTIKRSTTKQRVTDVKKTHQITEMVQCSTRNQGCLSNINLLYGRDRQQIICSSN